MSDPQLDFSLERLDARMAELLDSFESHPLMQPPLVHPTVFFMFDFVRNTHKLLRDIDSERFRSGDTEARAAGQEVLGRNTFTKLLVNDTTGKLAMITGGDPRNPVDFGPDIKAKAEALTMQ